VKNISQILQREPLVRLVQPANFVGWVYRLDYDTALVLTNDLWKAEALGVPHNCFLTATAFDPDDYATAEEEDREVLLFRVVGSCKLPQDDDLVRTKVDHFLRQQETRPSSPARDYDDITRNQLQFGGLECRVLGTFYVRDGELSLGSDLESFSTAARLNVYRPRGDALSLIVNYVDPLRRRAAVEEAEAMGLVGALAPFPIGTVRYTSTDRLHRGTDSEKVPVTIQPFDFLARRTAVLGMTRTGKSNMVKQTLAVVKRISNHSGVPIGQLVYDINGEYANANKQDKGAIADVFPQDTIRYRMLETAGFADLRNNFYEQVPEGFAVIRRELESLGRTGADYVQSFLNMSFDRPDEQERAEFSRWQRRVAAYKVLLYKADCEAPKGYKVWFDANQAVQQAVQQLFAQRQARGGPQTPARQFPDPKKDGLSLAEAAEWFELAREANKASSLPSSTPGHLWVDDSLQTLLDMIVQKNKNDAFISGHRLLAPAVKYHTTKRSAEVASEVYAHLIAGKIVILDLSVGDARMRETISKQIAQKVFSASMETFIKGERPPNVVVYIEEAHNLIGKDQDLTDTWPRLAKEGAKYRIALVYATQEVSSVHPNVLANTENWFISHLNNEREIKELSQFYDFADFGRSLLRAQDVGFARVKTLSSPFVVPVQIDKFDPAQVAASDARATGSANPIPHHYRRTEGVDEDNRTGRLF
jgi:hypothetical protein